MIFEKKEVKNMELTPELLSIFKQFYNNWKKFKGRRVRIWFSNPKSSHACFDIKLSEDKINEMDEVRQLDRTLAMDGTISGISEYPPGIFLTDLFIWALADNFQEARSNDIELKAKDYVKRIISEDKETLIMLNQIQRIDFIGLNLIINGIKFEDDKAKAKNKINKKIE